MNFPRFLHYETMLMKCCGEMANQNLGIPENVKSPKGPYKPSGPGGKRDFISLSNSNRFKVVAWRPEDEPEGSRGCK